MYTVDQMMLLLIFILLMVVEATAQTSIGSIEFNALHEFYDAMEGENWYWRTDLNYNVNITVDDDYLLVTPFNAGTRPIWNFSGYHDPCTELWQGVNCTCSNSTESYDLYSVTSNCTVIALELADYNLVGQLPSSISNLTRLRVLYLNSNGIYGSIPESISTLSNLHFINLAHNKLSSTIPSDIGLCSHLEHLHLEDNYLTGTIPESTYNLSILRYFNVGNNSLYGEFSSKFGQLTHLWYLELFSNGFTGTIPTEIGQCTELRDLYLYNNLLSGNITEALSLLINLNYLILFDNQLTGVIPAWIGSTTFLFVLDAGVNQLTGTVPYSVCGDGSYSLFALLLNANSLTGTIPECFTGKFSPIIELIFYNNFLTGTVPNNFSENVIIESLVFGLNLLTGTLPQMHNAHFLEFLYVQNNMLTGKLHDVFYPPSQPFISYVDFSNNEFTGTIPFSVYGLKLLRSLALVSNCFSGSISDQVCNMTSLEYLDMDGLHTAKNCQKRIFPFFSSYIMQNHFTGSIPTCLFEMKKIQTIHISGNSLKSSLPVDLVISDTITDITLSHNLLRGEIPIQMQTRHFATLDLSYNCFNGVLHPNFTTSNYLSLEVNRISGHIPGALRHATNLRILNSNLFSCNVEKNSLPLHDPDYSDYQCGSNAFDQSFALWGVLVVITLLVYFALRLSIKYQTSDHYKKVKEFFLLYVSVFQKFMMIYQKQDDKKQIEIVEFALYLEKLRSTFLQLTIVSCVVLCPLYFILSAFYSTHTHEYAWNASALYLTGEPPAVILMFVFLGLLSFIFWSVRNLLKHWLHEEAQIEDATSSERGITKSTFNTRRIVVLSIVASINCAMMLVLNSLYIYFVFEFNPFVVFVCQLMIALIKIFWNEYSLSWMVRTGKEKTRSITTQLSDRLKSGDTELGVDKATHYCDMDRQRDLNELKALQEQQRLEDANDMPILTFIVIFNTIIAPVIANSVLSDQCYENVFFPPSSVTSSGAYYVCEQQYTLLVTNIECFNNVVSYLNTSYDPPFIYRYGCSSSFIRHYASVYVYMFLLTGFGKPIGFMLWKYLYDHTKYPNLKRLMSLFLNKLLKEELIDDARLQSEEILFRKERFVLNNVSATCVLLTVGVVFPPLAVVVLFAIYSHTYMNQLIVGRFVSLFNGDMKQKVIANLCRDCEGIAILFKHSLLFMIPFTSIFYSFYLLDIYGDTVGWRRAIWAPVIVFMMPIVVWSVYQVYRIILAVRHQNQENEKVLGKLSRQRAETMKAMKRPSYYNRKSGGALVEMRKSVGETLGKAGNSVVVNPMNDDEDVE